MFRRRQPPPGLHQCLVCRGDFVVPVGVEALDDDRWDLRLRCGECGTYRDVVVSDDVAKRYDVDLRRGMEEIADALRLQDHERMTAGGDFASVEEDP